MPKVTVADDAPWLVPNVEFAIGQTERDRTMVEVDTPGDATAVRYHHPGSDHELQLYEVRFLGDFAAGNLIAEPIDPSDWLRIAELVSRYRDLPLGAVDASVCATAERLGVHEIATLDRRHFTVVRSTLGSLTLLPE